MSASEPRVLLIGGSSNIGKSTVAALLGARTGWTSASTDKMARHPGRPWPVPGCQVPPHVARHYLELSPDELIRSVLTHYRNMWPTIRTLIAKHAEDTGADRLVLEGSALLPETVATLDVDGVAAVWLTAGDELFRTRIARDSGLADLDPRGREMVEKFIGRTLRYNAHMMDGMRAYGLPFVTISGMEDAQQVAQACHDVSRAPR